MLGLFARSDYSERGLYGRKAGITRNLLEEAPWLQPRLLAKRLRGIHLGSHGCFGDGYIWIDLQEFEHTLEPVGRVRSDLLEQNCQDLVPPEQIEIARQLMGVESILDRVGSLCDGLFERARLNLMEDPSQVTRVSPVDRVSQRHEQLDVGKMPFY